LARPKNNPEQTVVIASQWTRQPFYDIRLISFAECCEVLNVSSWTLGRWVAAGKFPAPLHLTPTSPRQFRVRDIAHFLDKRRRGRRVKPAPRGALKRRSQGGGDASAAAPQSRGGQLQTEEQK
jgi:hypothetical protein